MAANAGFLWRRPGAASRIDMAPYMTKGLVGKLFGDKEYISHGLFESLFKQGLQLNAYLRII